MNDAKPRNQTLSVAPCRMPPIPREQMTDAQKKAAAEIEAGPRGGVMEPFVAILRSPGLTEPAQKLGAYIRWGVKLDLRVAELAGLMTARFWQQQYEFHVSMIAMVMNVARTEIPDGKPIPLAPLQDHVRRS